MWSLVAEDDVDGAVRPHDRDLRRGIGEVHVAPDVLGGHDVIGPAVGLPGDDRDFVLRLRLLILQSVKSSQNGIIESGVHLEGNVIIGKDTLIRANSYIVGPVVIGKGCEIGPNVCILPATSIGDNVTISCFTEIKNSVIEGDISINSNSLIQDSVIDSGCVIGAQFSAISDEAEVKIDHEYHTVKMGAILGRSCRIGSTVTAQAGTIIGNYCQIKPLKLVSGNIPDRSFLV